MDLATWLRQIGLERYCAVFAEHDVDLETLPHLSEQDLKELGLSLGHRRKLLAACADHRTSPGPAREAAVPGKRAAERRQVTVMFCDLVGSTELAQRLDPEALRDVMHRYQDAVAGAVARFGGHVAKYLGDGVVAVFGWPRAHEDQAERAVRAALAAEKAITGVVAEGAVPNPLQARFGIATGSVVIGDLVGDMAEERDAISGGAPSLAARLQGIADPGTIVIDDATRRLVGQGFELADLGEHRLKGFSRPIRAWRPVGEMATGSRFEAVRGSTLTRFVGRDHELAVLHEAWAQARKGNGQTVVLSGEAGLGKSRVLREFVRCHRPDRAQLLQLQCSPHAVHAAFHPLLEHIARAARLSPHDDPERRLDLLEAHLTRVLGEFREAAALLSGLLGLPSTRCGAVEMSPQRRKLRTIESFVTYITALARRGSLLALVEDIHWVDPSSFETLDAIVKRSTDLPVLIVMTHRPEFEPRWNGGGHRTHLSLTRLGHSQGRALAEQAASGKQLPEEVVARIVAQTDGIPLFIEELTRTVLEAGLLEDRGDRYEMSGPLPPLAIPTTLRDSLMARLDKLASFKEVIQAAACIGREFDRELLRHVVAMSANQLDHALDELVGAQLVFRRAAEEGFLFVFKHALVQDAAYDSLLMSRREQLHQRLAAILEASGDADPLDLARHLAAAGIPERAAGAYAEAGEALLAHCSLREAVGALELGLEQCQRLEGTRRGRLELRIRIGLAAARMASFGWAHRSVSAALEPAYDLALAADDRDALGPILWGLWVHYQTRTEFPQAHAWLARLETAAERFPQGDLPAVHDASAGCQYFWQAKYARALSYTEHLQATYDPKRHRRIVAYANHDPLCFALHWAGALLDWITGYPDRSLERLEIALERARQLGHAFNLAFALTGGASNLFYLGQADRLLAHCGEVVEIGEREGLGAFSQHVLDGQWRGAALICRGEHASGYPLIRAGNDYWNGVGGRICNAMFWSWIALGHAGCGRTGEALASIEAAITHCRRTGDRFMEPECLRLRAEFMAAGEAADRSSIERQLIEAIEVARRHEARSWELRTATSLAGRYREAERDADARAVLEPAIGGFTEGFRTPDIIAACALLDQL